MSARVLFAGLVAISTVALAGSASAKASLAEANITGPGLGSGMRIEAPETEGLWKSGIDVAGGLDDTRAESVDELGLTRADLGPKYLVTYRFHGSDNLVRQDLYPFAKGAPVTYTRPGQELNIGIKMSIISGWYKSSRGFFDYLVDHGLPKTNPVAQVATREPAPDTAPGVQRAPRASIVVVLVGVAALSLGALALRRGTLNG